MRCPFCGSVLHQVIDKRAVASSGEIRRRRECLKCRRRFTTYEKVVSLEMVVVKRDGRKELFSREKLKNGIAKALEKRPAADRIDLMVEKIERKLRRKNAAEVTSKLIGQMVLAELKKADIVAYLRFASVYRQFKQPEDFARELSALEEKRYETKIS